jgi:transposase-like protein
MHAGCRTPLGGKGKVVEIDETFLGGKVYGKGVKAAIRNKVKVLGIVERNGRVHLQTIADGKAGTLRPIFQSKLDPRTSKVVSDGATNYESIFNPAKLEQFKHEDDFATKGELSAKTIEGAFSLFKRGVIGSYHHLS